ncbi:hypothetical protein QQ045_026617 [Rhodiola kirilowii]
MKFCCYGVRVIWFNRNLVFHGQHGPSVEAGCGSIKATMSLFLKLEFRFTVLDMEGLSKWEAPKDGFLKINVDGSWDAETGIAGCAGQARWRKCIFETDSSELFAYVSLKAKAPERFASKIKLGRKTGVGLLR